MKRVSKAVYICLITMLIFLMSVDSQAAVKMNKKTAAIIKGSTISLKVTGTKSKPVWESSKPKVASVNSNGSVKGLAVGTSTIKAKVGKKTYSCKVTVEDPKINRSSLTVEIKKSAKLKISGTKQKVKWSSSNKKVARVTSKGVVKGINGGKAIITATVGGKKLACSVTVPTPRISNTSANLEVGKTIQLRITGSSQKVTWKSSNKKIATVTSKGLVKGIKQGTVTITAYVAGKNCRCNINVKKMSGSSGLKAKYHIKKYSQLYSNYRTGRYTFQLPQLEGTSEGIKKINASLYDIYKATWVNRDRMKDYANNPSSVQRGWVYHFDTICDVTYNDKGIVSFRFAQDWFAGGVHTAYHYGATYNLKTGKRLILTDVMSGTQSTILNKIVNAYAKILPGRSTSIIREDFNYSKPFSDILFWLSEGRVYISNGSLVPGGGLGELTVVLNGNY